MTLSDNTTPFDNMTSHLFRKAGIFAIYAIGALIIMLQCRSIFG